MRLALLAAIAGIVLVAVPTAQPRTGATAPAILSATVDPQGGLRFEYRPPDYCPSGYSDFLIVNDDGATGSDGGLLSARNVTSFVCSWTSVRVENFLALAVAGPGTHYIQVRHWDVTRLNFYYSNVVRVVVPGTPSEPPTTTTTTGTATLPTPPPTTTTPAPPKPLRPLAITIDYFVGTPKAGIGSEASRIYPRLPRPELSYSFWARPRGRKFCQLFARARWRVRPARVGGRAVRIQSSGRCDAYVEFPEEGTYTVEATVYQEGFKPATASMRALINNWLIVVVGDSVASGEGNPPFRDQRCHVSDLAFGRQAAESINRKDLRADVTFVTVACSGAQIFTGLLGPYCGLVEPSECRSPIRPQLQQLKEIVGDREIDALVVSVGANDVKFGSLVETCFLEERCTAYVPKGESVSLDRLTRERIASLTRRYAELAKALRRLVPPKRVYITEYFDPTFVEAHRLCRELVGGWRPDVARERFVIDADETRWAHDTVVAGLNRAVRAAAATHGWRLVGGIATGFGRHGYCVDGKDRWIVSLLESRRRQGDTYGTMHPNAAGHQHIAGKLEEMVRADLEKRRGRR